MAASADPAAEASSTNGSGSSSAPASEEVIKAYDSPEPLKALADVLRSKVKIRHGVLREARIEYFKGERLLEFLMSAECKVGHHPKLSTKEDAIEVAKLLLKAQVDGQPIYFIRSDKVKKGVLEISKKQEFEEKGYYTWIYEGPQAMSNLMTFLIIAGFLAITCFPIWPHFLKVWLWYVSVTLLAFMLGFLLLRFLAFLLFWVLGYEFWFLPNLFDESLSFVDSFKPVQSFEKSPTGQGIYRAAVVVAFAAFVYWAYSQPTEFDSLVAAQKQFMHDLYEGNLLADVAQSDKDNIDKPRHYPSYEELMKEAELDNTPADGMTEEERADSVIDSLLGNDHDEDDDEEDARDEQHKKKEVEVEAS